MRLISPTGLKEMMELGTPHLIIDIRDPEDFDFCSLPNSINVPKPDFDAFIPKIPKDVQVILVCKYGKKSEQLVLILKVDHGYRNICSLEGGLWDWSREIDPAMIVW